jgi:hypothetical protein
MYKGTIIENSLNDRSILSKVQIQNTSQAGSWILHDILADEEIIPELSESLADGAWYIHLWKPGKDEVKVIFKNKVFDIKFSDKSSWAEAVAYGKSIGIPDEQLDFPIN